LTLTTTTYRAYGEEPAERPSRRFLDDVTVRDHGQLGLSTYNGVPRLTNSFVTGNMIGIDTNRYVVLIDSTVTGNSAENIRSTHGVRLHGSSTVGP